MNRNHKKRTAVGFIKNFRFKRGAVASSIAHDSHNIVVVGADDPSIARAVQRIMEERGGISVVHGEREEILPLPIGGIMSDAEGEKVARDYERLNQIAKEMGCRMAEIGRAHG